MFLKRARPTDIITAFTPKGLIGYRLGTSNPRCIKSNRRRIKRGMERRLMAMNAILPPQQGHRRAEFSSPIPGEWF